MLYPAQKTTANTIGILIGLAAIAVLLVSNLPKSDGHPTMGADVTMNAWIGGNIDTNPRQPKNFIDAKNLTAGGPAASGVMTFASDNGDTKRIAVRASEATAQQYGSEDFARQLLIEFGKNGSLGSSTLAQLAETPLPLVYMKPKETRNIPVTASFPLGAGDQIAGKQIEITLIPEHAE